MNTPQFTIALTLLLSVGLAPRVFAGDPQNSTTTPSLYDRGKGWVQDSSGRWVFKQGVKQAAKGLGKRAAGPAGEIFEWVAPKKAYAPTTDGEPFASERRRQQERERQYQEYQEKQRRYWNEVQRGIAEDQRRREQRVRDAYQRTQQQQSRQFGTQNPQFVPQPTYEWRWVNGQLRQVRVR